MKLIICCGDQKVVIPGITLQEGFIPTLALQKADGSECFETFPLEPAVWFKVLLLDWVQIDCTPKREKITYKELQKSDEKLVSSWDSTTLSYPVPVSSTENEDVRSVWVGWVHLDHDTTVFHSNMQKVFSSVREAVEKCASLEKAGGDIFQTLMKVLHVNVLPVIRLDETHDQNNLRVALEEHCKLIALHKDQINKGSRTYDKDVKELRKKRNRIVECLLRGEGSQWLSSNKFVKLLQKDLENDVNILEEKVFGLEIEKEQIDNEIEKRLESISKDEPLPPDVEEMLVHNQLSILLKMERRNEIFHNFKDCSKALELKLQSKRFVRTPACLQQLRTACDNPERVFHLLEKFTNPSSYKKSKRHLLKQDRTLLNIEHKIYMSMNSKVKHQQQKLERMAEEDAALVSVREAMKLTLRDFEADGESYGVSWNTLGNAMATDVLVNKNALSKDWCNLADLIQGMVHDEKSRVGQLHEKFCEEILNLCGSVREEFRSAHTIVHMAPSILEEESLNSTSSTPAQVAVHMPENDNSPEVRFKANGGNNLSARHSSANSFHCGSSQYVTRSGAHVQLGLKFIVNVVNKIQSHINEVCDLVKKEIKYSGEKAHKNIYVCYEHHVYTAIMPELDNLYMMLHKDVVRKLGHSLPTMDVASLKMESSFVRSMLLTESRPSRSPSISSNCSMYSMRFLQKRPSISSAVHLPRRGSVTRSTCSKQSSGFVDDLASMTDSEMQHDYGSMTGSVYSCRSSVAWGKVGGMESGFNSDTSSFASGVYYSRRSPNAPRPESPLIEEASLTESEMMAVGDCGSSTESARFSCDDFEETSYVSMKLKPNHLPCFKSAISHLERAVKSPLPLIALKSLQGCGRELHKITYQLEGREACADDMLDLTQVLLCNCQIDLASRLYVRILLLDALVEMAPSDSFSFMDKYVKLDSELEQMLTTFAGILDRLAGI